MLDRTAELRASQAKMSFKREATDTSMGSSSSADNSDLAALLPPPRMNLSIDVEAINSDGTREANNIEGAENMQDSPSASASGELTPKIGRKKSSGKKFHLVDFHDGNSKETWVISDEGAMRLEEYNVKVGEEGLESTRQGSITR